MPKKAFRKVTLSEGKRQKRHKICFSSSFKRVPTQQRTKPCVQFGDKSYSNYTIHKDPKRKANYIKLHKKRESWTNPHTPGFWAKHLLWNKPTIEASIKDIKKKFKIKVVKKR